EAELGMVIGKRTAQVSEAEAMDHVFGYVNFIDGSARGLPPTANSFFQMKSRETFCPIGPFLVTKDEIPNPQKLAIKLWNNGVLMQDFNSDDMAHKLPRCISWLSSIHTLVPGDIIATGTNHRGLNPFLDGDKIELEVEGLGRLHISVRDDLKRKWDRVTRLQRQQARQEGTTPQVAGKYTPKA
ncbi:MAG: fumarylacetoacetate hydrolase family protein, partial [Chloroflexota bacterium]